VPVGSKVGRSTPLAIAACTPTSWPFENCSCPTRTSSAVRPTGSGLLLQMAGFENGRLQTTARAVGRHAGSAYEAALDYAQNRVVFGEAIINYELTRVKLGTMAAIIPVRRQFSLEVAREMARGGGSLEASMAKAYVCPRSRVGYARGDADSRRHGLRRGVRRESLLVDARVLSIFEGADETLCLKVIVRRLLEELPRSLSRPRKPNAGPATSPRGPSSPNETLGAVQNSGLDWAQARAPLFFDVAVAPDEHGAQPRHDEHADDDHAGLVDVEAGHKSPERTFK